MSGLVLQIKLKGITFADQGEIVKLEAAAGETFDEVVAEAVEKGYWGLENLSAIPGTVGATPIQNVGAYGVEIADLIERVTVFNPITGELESLTPAQCQFSYRNSIFKHSAGRHYIVVSVTLCLHKKATPKLAYADVAAYGFDAATVTPLQVRLAITEIRSKKFPDWHRVGTAGSFFKNPIITKDKYGELKKEYPELPFFEVNETHVKIPLAWVLDTVCKLKGFKMGSVGLYEHQPLALVNFGNGNEKEITALAEYVSRKVKEKINVDIEWEVQRIV